MNSVKRKIKHEIFVARPAKRNNLPSNITSFFGIWNEMEYREHFVLWDMVMRNSSNRFCFLEVKVLAKQNASLWQGNEAVNWAFKFNALNCFAMAHHFSLKIMLWGGLSIVPWTGCPPGKALLAPKLCVTSLRTLPSSLF